MSIYTHLMAKICSLQILLMRYLLSWANLAQLEDLIHYYHLSTGTVTQKKLIQNVYEIERILEPSAFNFLNGRT